jgi:hypothetical protein
VKAVRLLAALAVAAASLPAVGQDAALRLEMLAERIAKLHAQVGMGVLADRGRRALPEAMREFDSGLRQAQARATGAELRDNYVLLGLLWSEYRSFASKAPTRDNAKKVAERAEEVAWIAAKGARLMHEPGRRGTGRLALDAAHAGTLSQRLARLHLMQRWGVRQETSAREIPAVSADLQRTLEKLRAAPQNTPEIDTELQAAEGQLAFLLQGGRELEGRRANARALEFIAKSGDHLLDSMERLVRLYEGAP